MNTKGCAVCVCQQRAAMCCLENSPVVHEASSLSWASPLAWCHTGPVGGPPLGGGESVSSVSPLAPWWLGHLLPRMAGEPAVLLEPISSCLLLKGHWELGGRGSCTCASAWPGHLACWLVFNTKCQEGYDSPGLPFSSRDKRLTLPGGQALCQNT